MRSGSRLFWWRRWWRRWELALFWFSITILALGVFYAWVRGLLVLESY
jgi:hypothetical protein